MLSPIVRVICENTKKTFLRNSRNFSNTPTPPSNFGPCKEMNMCTAINSALHICMEKDPLSVIFGEDVAFGGVFRCSVDLLKRFGPQRVMNSPISEQGIVGFGIGLAAVGVSAIAEIQFGDYIFPAFDQIVNEAAKFRYRSGNHWDVGKLTIRSTWGAVGHGGLYHSQSPEAYFAHTPGLVIVVPSNPYAAKGLLIKSIRDPNPVLFFEPKALYRSSVGMVPEGDYELDLSKANIVKEGKDITLVGYGTMVNEMLEAAKIVSQEGGIDAEVIDLQTIVPFDVDTITNSVNKTGRLIVTHEAPKTQGFAAEIASTVYERCFYKLQAPIKRLCGYDTPFPLVYEKFYLPNKHKIADSIKELCTQ